MTVARAVLIQLLVLVLVAGCGDDAQPQPVSKQGPEEAAEVVPAPQPEPAEPAAAAEDRAATARPTSHRLPDPLRGRVKETMNSGGYTYVLLGTEHGDVWAAAKEFAVSPGDEVEVGALMPMHNFHSATLQRTFQQIQFVERAMVVGSSSGGGPGQPTPGTPSAGMPPGHPPVGGAAAQSKPGPLTPEPGEIDAIPDGATVAELFDNRADLQGKAVKFRGRVVKANRGIMGRNWLHIQDGTGEPGSNDITVTSATGFAAPGTIVVVEGTLGIERDFGAGYAYDVIVEDATITVEPTDPDASGPAE
jgi:hypothetical protein